jgi:flagellar hook-basal body complex protein FliE
MVQLNPFVPALQQMRALAFEAAGPSSLAPAQSNPTANGSIDFATLFQQSLARISASQAASRSEMQAFQLGASNVSLNDAVVDAAKAGIAFQESLQIRNKLVSAYTDIMQTPL